MAASGEKLVDVDVVIPSEVEEVETTGAGVTR
jgi:hypothetical protein